jgi:hypothetical protein
MELILASGTLKNLMFLLNLSLVCLPTVPR